MLSGLGTVYMNPGPEPLPRADLKAHAAQAEALMAFMTERIDADLLDACPKLKIVAGALKGFDNVDLDACAARGVTFTYVEDLLTIPTAELALGLMIGLCRNMLPGDAHVRSGSFKGWRPRLYGGSLEGACVAVIGAGAVGQALLGMLSGFKCRKRYTDVAPLPPETEAALGAKFAELDDIITTADFVVLAVPLTAKTLGLVNRSFLDRMKPGAYLVNPARGSIVVETEVARALQTGHLAGYAADVFEMEDMSRADAPPQIARELLAAPNTFFTPHLGSAVVQTRAQIAASAASSIREHLL
jgi:phosphonate dehydrogenase